MTISYDILVLISIPVVFSRPRHFPCTSDPARPLYPVMAMTLPGWRRVRVSGDILDEVPA